MLRHLKEPFCGLSHAAGALLSLVALVALMFVAQGRARHLAVFGIYGASLVALYASSALYHSLRVSARAERWLQRLDHCAIYLLIAGSYTPICWLGIGGILGKSLLAIEWILAFSGIASSLLWHRGPDWLRVSVYIVMGWLVLVALGPLHATISGAGLAWLVAGGVIYSVGTVIFALDKPHLWPGKFSAHDLWHLFVMGGSACHFVVMAVFIARVA